MLLERYNEITLEYLCNVQIRSETMIAQWCEFESLQLIRIMNRVFGEENHHNEIVTSILERLFNACFVRYQCQDKNLPPSSCL